MFDFQGKLDFTDQNFLVKMSISVYSEIRDMLRTYLLSTKRTLTMLTNN